MDENSQDKFSCFLTAACVVIGSHYPSSYAFQGTMKYGQHLKDSIAPEYGPEPYLDYDKLKRIIRRLSEKAPDR
jgi:hypothetical protein